MGRRNGGAAAPRAQAGAAGAAVQRRHPSCASASKRSRSAPLPAAPAGAAASGARTISSARMALMPWSNLDTIQDSPSSWYSRIMPLMAGGARGGGEVRRGWPAGARGRRRGQGQAAGLERGAADGCDTGVQAAVQARGLQWLGGGRGRGPTGRLVADGLGQLPAGRRLAGQPGYVGDGGAGDEGLQLVHVLQQVLCAQFRVALHGRGRGAGAG
jgi:hypothetical protein